MPARSNKGLAAVSSGFKHDHFGMLFVVVGKRVNLKISEEPSEGNVFLGGDVLITKHQHLVVHPRLMQLVTGRIVDRCHIETENLGAESRRERTDIESREGLCHRVLLSLIKTLFIKNLVIKRASLRRW